MDWSDGVVIGFSDGLGVRRLNLSVNRLKLFTRTNRFLDFIGSLLFSTDFPCLLVMVREVFFVFGMAWMRLKRKNK